MALFKNIVSPAGAGQTTDVNSLIPMKTAMKMLGITLPTYYQRIKEGRLHAIKINRLVFIHPHEVHEEAIRLEDVRNRHRGGLPPEMVKALTSMRASQNSAHDPDNVGSMVGAVDGSMGSTKQPLGKIAETMRAETMRAQTTSTETNQATKTRQPEAMNEKKTRLGRSKPDPNENEVEVNLSGVVASRAFKSFDLGKTQRDVVVLHEINPFTARQLWADYVSLGQEWLLPHTQLSKLRVLLGWNEDPPTAEGLINAIRTFTAGEVEREVSRASAVSPKNSPEDMAATPEELAELDKATAEAELEAKISAKLGDALKQPAENIKVENDKPPVKGPVK